MGETFGRWALTHAQKGAKKKGVIQTLEALEVVFGAGL
jgi:hypothetical protein